MLSRHFFLNCILSSQIPMHALNSKDVLSCVTLTVVTALALHGGESLGFGSACSVFVTLIHPAVKDC